MNTPPGSSPAKPRLSLYSFATILGIEGKDGLPLLIVGGHSVNAWAHYYFSAVPMLAQHLPFTSKDLDCLGTLDDIWIIQKKSGWEWIPCKADIKEFIVGALRHQETPDDPVLLVEVLKRAHGASCEEILKHAFTIQIEIKPDERHQIRVPDPLLLLRMKIENAVHFPQDDPDRPRQDIKHVRMLTLCTHAFLKELLETQTELKEQVLIAQYELKRLLHIKNNHATYIFIQRHGFELADCVPKSYFELANRTEKQTIQIRKLMTQAGFAKAM